ncbi:MAG: SseB family protein [Butyrivibrio sp.]|nr:SseB family protein [Butyrivibrio sp.]
MTREERTRHAHAISDRYVPWISPDDTETMKEIKNLPIQDIITIHSNARFAIEKGMFVGISKDALRKKDSYAIRFNQAVEAIKKIIIERLRTADRLWTVTDRITHSPFIDDGNRAWVFTEREYADECVGHFMKQFRTTFEVTEIPHSDLFRFFGISAYMRGVETFQVDILAYSAISIKSEEIIPAPDFSKTPAINRPVMNPDFFRAVAKFQEERLYSADYKGKKEMLKSLEEDMVKAFRGATFLVPVKGMDQISKKIDAKGSVKKGTKISIPCLSKGTGKDETNATPVFTDWDEFNKVYSQEEWGGWIWKASDLSGAPEDMIVVNAGSLGFEMSKGMIRKMLGKRKFF